MVVCWKEQQRLIGLKDNDDLNTIEKSIIDILIITNVRRC